MILIGLGSNLTTGEYPTSKAILDAAIDALASYDIRTLECSRYYETEPVPKSDQPWYVNAVISVDTALSARDLLSKMHEIEHSLGRIRRKKWEARIIDLDLLCYNDEVLPSVEKWADAAAGSCPGEAIIPHGRLHERDFVLIPISDITRDWVHPVLHKNVELMLKEQKSDGIVRLL